MINNNKWLIKITEKKKFKNQIKLANPKEQV